METVPGSRVEMPIPVDSLLRLPEGAIYHAKSGRTAADVSRKGDTIYVTATCDSIQREVEDYEECRTDARTQSEHSSNDVRTASESEREGTMWTYWPLIASLLFLAAGIAMGIKYKQS